MEGFGLPVTISVDNHSELKRPKLGGKVFYKRQWISATNFVIKVRKYNWLNCRNFDFQYFFLKYKKIIFFFHISKCEYIIGHIFMKRPRICNFIVGIQGDRVLRVFFVIMMLIFVPATSSKYSLRNIISFWQTCCNVNRFNIISLWKPKIRARTPSWNSV